MKKLLFFLMPTAALAAQGPTGYAALAPVGKAMVLSLFGAGFYLLARYAIKKELLENSEQ